MTIQTDHTQQLAEWAATEEGAESIGRSLRPADEASRHRADLILDLASQDDPEAAEIVSELRGRGRPSLTATGGESPTWRVRVPGDLDADARRLARSRGIDFSDLVRDAVGEYVRKAV